MNRIMTWSIVNRFEGPPACTVDNYRLHYTMILKNRDVAEQEEIIIRDYSVQEFDGRE